MKPSVITGSKIVGTHLDDVLIGTDGSDVILGRGGNDLLIGGPGDDTLTGGRGMDSFELTPWGGHDTITDYQPGEALIFQYGVNTLPAGNLTNGETVQLAGGYVFTAADDANGNAVLSVQINQVTADSFTLLGVSVEQIDSSWLQFVS